MTRNWIYRRFLEVAMAQNSENPELCEILKAAKYLGYLGLDREKNVRPDVILDALIKTANSLDNRTIAQMEDLEAQGMYMFAEEMARFRELGSRFKGP